MIDYLKQNHLSILIIVVLGAWFLLSQGQGASVGAPRSISTFTNPITFEQEIIVNEGGHDRDTRIEGDTDTELIFVDAGNDSVTTGGFTWGGGATTLTDADGGTYTLTEAEMLGASVFEFAAGGAGQETITLTLPATSTMTTLIPDAGDCREWLYDASALVAATTTTITAGTGHDVIAVSTANDVIDGAEWAEIKSCRQSDGDVTTIVSELLHAD